MNVPELHKKAFEMVSELFPGTEILDAQDLSTKEVTPQKDLMWLGACSPEELIDQWTNTVNEPELIQFLKSETIQRSKKIDEYRARYLAIKRGLNAK